MNKPLVSCAAAACLAGPLDPPSGSTDPNANFSY